MTCVCPRCYRRVPIAPLEIGRDGATPVAHVVLGPVRVCRPDAEDYTPEQQHENLNGASL